MPTALDITNQVFGRLTAIKPLKKKVGVATFWLCLCSCGNTKAIRIDSLTSGASQSCGCKNSEEKRALKGKDRVQYKHGMSLRNKKTPFYHVWMHLKGRCNNSKLKEYKYYGGRGIKVCKRWMDFQNFMDDMYTAYLKHKKENSSTTIDRIDNDGNYEPSNCRWATYKVQANNKRRKI